MNQSKATLHPSPILRCNLYIYKEGEFVCLSVRCPGQLLSCLWADLAETLVDGQVGHGYHCHQVAPQLANRGRCWSVKGAFSQLSEDRFG